MGKESQEKAPTRIKSISLPPREAIVPQRMNVDTTQIYLEEIGQPDLLTSDQEIEYGKTIHQGRIAYCQLEELVNSDQFSLATRNEIGQILSSPRYKFLADGQSPKKDPNFAHYGVGQLEETVFAAKAAYDTLIVHNLKLVVTIARRYPNNGLSLQDRIQEGNFGLFEAAAKFDYRKGFRFTTYAIWWIRQKITRALQQKSRTIPLPIHVQQQLKHLERIEERLTTDLGRQPTLEELEVSSGIPVETVRQLRQADQDILYLSQPLYPEDSNLTIEGLPEQDQNQNGTPTVEEEVQILELKSRIQESLDILDPKERLILELRYGLVDGRSRTLGEVGKKFGFTRERARQLEMQALKRLRRKFEMGNLKQAYL